MIRTSHKPKTTKQDPKILKFHFSSCPITKFSHQSNLLTYNQNWKNCTSMYSSAILLDMLSQNTHLVVMFSLRIQLYFILKADMHNKHKSVQQHVMLRNSDVKSETWLCLILTRLLPSRAPVPMPHTHSVCLPLTLTLPLTLSHTFCLSLSPFPIGLDMFSRIV